ncbi:MAG: class I SAM-dependent methyltransferase [Candidatus Hodarchaeota archaeon]
MEMVNINSWEEKFNQQLKWTAHLRDRLYERANLTEKRNLLEVGCGSGELLKEIGVKFNLKLFGIDINEDRIKYATENLRINLIEAKLYVMNILNNNFEKEMFDVVVTHFLFLWIKDLEKIFTQLHRIIKKNGVLLIFDEPDFGGLIEYPETNLKKEILHDLKKEGADPEIGRKLNQFFPDKFRVGEHFCTSFPWIPNLYKHELVNDLDFFKRRFNVKKFNSDLMRKSIETNKYFLFIPSFSYYLTKI